MIWLEKERSKEVKIKQVELEDDFSHNWETLNVWGIIVGLEFGTIHL